jgi:DNA polymerase I
MKNHLIIDGLALAYRSHFAHPNLQTVQGVFSGCMYGFLTSMATQKKKFPDFCFTVAWDNKPTRKLASYPNYKFGRNSYDISSQVNDIKEVLSCMAVTQAQCVGEEADDVIATLVSRYRGDGKVYILTSDKDLMQLVENGKVIMIRPGEHGVQKYYDEEEVEKEFGVRPKDLSCFLALKGDIIDSVPGLPRVRSKIISNLVNKYRTVDEIYNKLSEEKLTVNERQAFDKFKEQSKINFYLTNLVDNLSLEIITGQENPDKMQNILNNYEIKKINATDYIKLYGKESSFLYRTGDDPVIMNSLFD